MRTKAFTLIELLVVIAIIAILAAILFPVFAQAKDAAKKTQTISNAKSIGTALILYTDSSDDSFPLQASFNSATNSWRWNTPVQTPLGWTGDSRLNPATRQAEDSIMWSNSILPYSKSGAIYELAGASRQYDWPITGVAAGRPFKMGFTYNGLLHALTSTAAASPASLPLVWNGNGRQNVTGFAYSQPALKCDQINTPSCAYNPGRHPQTGLPGQGGTLFWINGCEGKPSDANGPTHKVHGDDAIMVYADSHVKPFKVGMTVRPGDTNVNVDPNTKYYAGGRCAQSHWWDQSHPWLFRPDYTP